MQYLGSEGEKARNREKQGKQKRYHKVEINGDIVDKKTEGKEMRLETVRKKSKGDKMKGRINKKEMNDATF